MNMETVATRDTGERRLPTSLQSLRGSRRFDQRQTKEILLDLERVRRFTTLEVRWDTGIERLTIDDVHVDDCVDVATRIMEVLPFDSFELDSVDSETVRYRITLSNWSLRTVVFFKKSLRRLAADAGRAVKIEYLRRDLLWATRSRRSFVYPAALRHTLE